MNISSRPLLLERYAIEQELGRSNHHHTYLVADQVLPNQRLIIKMFRTGVLASERRRIEDLASRIIKVHKHHRLPSLIDCLSDDSYVYLLLEYIEGYSIAQELQQQGYYAEGQALDLLGESLNILAYIHTSQLVHGDIKPENILRRSIDQKVVFIDLDSIQPFGTLFDPNEQGTPGYVPAVTSEGKLDPSLDIYALGMVVFEAVTGRSASGASRYTNGEICWTEGLQINNRFRTVLTYMTHEDPSKRYQSVQEVLEELRKTTPYFLPQSTQVGTPFLVKTSLEMEEEPASRGSFWRKSLFLIGALLLSTALPFLITFVIFNSLLEDPDRNITNQSPPASIPEGELTTKPDPRERTSRSSQAPTPSKAENLPPSIEQKAISPASEQQELPDVPLFQRPNTEEPSSSTPARSSEKKESKSLFQDGR